MKALNDQQLSMAAGGASSGTVDVNVSLNFNGKAAEAMANVDSIQFKFCYGEKSIPVTITKQSGWSEDIVSIPKGVEFWCELDFSPWPQITDFKYTWDKASSRMHYEVY